MIDNEYCYCRDCDRSFRYMLDQLVLEDPKLRIFKRYLDWHVASCTDECKYRRFSMYLNEKYPNGYGAKQLSEVTEQEFRACICYYMRFKNEVIDD